MMKMLSPSYQGAVSTILLTSKHFLFYSLQIIIGIMQTFAINYITNSGTIVLVQQSAIPISMAISKYALQAQYTFSQYLGATVVLFGIFIVLIPNFTSPSSSDSSTNSSEANYEELLWILVLVLSCIPMCLSSVYKEKALGETEIDVVYLNGWVAVYQFLFALPLCVPSSQVINMSISDILPNMWGGALCWVGIDTITTPNNQGLPADSCATAPLFVTTYLGFNIVFNILIVVILKHGSANILWMASTVIVPLSNVAFSLNFMPGHKPMNNYDICGLFIIMLGLIFYRFMGQILSYIDKLRGILTPVSDDEEERTRIIERKAEGKQTRYVGLNQIEALQSLIDTRILKEHRKALFRSPVQIRESLFVRLGVPPSPHISFTPNTSLNTRRNSITKNVTISPNIPRKNKNVIDISPIIPSRGSSLSASNGTGNNKKNDKNSTTMKKAIDI